MICFFSGKTFASDRPVGIGEPQPTTTTTTTTTTPQQPQPQQRHNNHSCSRDRKQRQQQRQQRQEHEQKPHQPNKQSSKQPNNQALSASCANRVESILWILLRFAKEPHSPLVAVEHSQFYHWTLRSETTLDDALILNSLV